jgi:tetratricopeptide (TPR) repeat protein
MTRRIITGVLALAAGITSLMAQPRPKGPKEVEALQAMFNATTPDARIAAAENLITKFADTDFKDLALYMAAFSCQQKGDAPKAIVYAERVLATNPKHYQAMLMLGELIAQQTKEFDLDREEKLTTAEKHVKAAMETVQTAPKPNPGLTDEQWAAGKKDMTAQAHQALGMIAVTRKKNDVAIAEFKAAIASSSQPEPAYSVRLAQAYVAAGNFDEAITITEQLIALPNLHPQIKNAATSIRDTAKQAKGAGKPATPAAPKPGQVEIKQP